MPSDLEYTAYGLKSFKLRAWGPCPSTLTCLIIMTTYVCAQYTASIIFKYNNSVNSRLKTLHSIEWETGQQRVKAKLMYVIN